MKKSSYIKVCLIVLLCYLSSCSLVLDTLLECPKSNIKLGFLDVNKPNFIPTPKPSKLIYSNQKFGEITIESTYNGEKTQERILHYETLCSRPLKSQYTYFTTMERQREYESSFEKLYLAYNYHITQTHYANKDTVFHDRLSIYISNRQDNWLYLDIIVSDRQNLVRLDTISQRIMKFTKMVKDTTINGNNLRNVYYNTLRSDIYYGEGIGIVAFKYKNEWWYLKQ